MVRLLTQHGGRPSQAPTHPGCNLFLVVYHPRPRGHGAGAPVLALRHRAGGWPCAPSEVLSPESNSPWRADRKASWRGAAYTCCCCPAVREGEHAHHWWPRVQSVQRPWPLAARAPPHSCQPALVCGWQCLGMRERAKAQLFGCTLAGCATCTCMRVHAHRAPTARIASKSTSGACVWPCNCFHV